MQIKTNCLKLISFIRAKSKLINVIGNDEYETVNSIRQSVISWMLHQQSAKKIDIDKNFKYSEWTIIKGLQVGKLVPFDVKAFPQNVWTNVLAEKDAKDAEVNKVFQFKDNAENDPTQDLMTALQRFEADVPPDKDKAGNHTHIILIKDIHGLIKNNIPLIRKLKEIAMNTEPKNVHRHIVILGPVKSIPVDMENMTAVLEWKLPDAEDIAKYLSSLATYKIISNDKKPDEKADVNEYTEQEFKDITNSFIGLPHNRIEEHACLSYVQFKRRLNPKLLAQLKTKHILENSSLELLDTNVHMDNVGGMETFKKWIEERANAFSKEAQEFGVESPKGVMLVGIQGCGKTLMSRAIASKWGLPLIRFDVAKVFSKTIGSSEENIRNTLATIEALSPCVVQIDEIEKALSGVGSSNMSDGGTTYRVVGTLLSWMQDKEAQAFIIATANDVSQLPPELLRKGRFDEIFFCALPEENEREEIFNIHLGKRTYKGKDFNCSLFASKTRNYSGAEIEQIIKQAILFAFNDKARKLKDEHIVKAIRDIIPLYETCKQDIDWLLAWVGWDEERQEGLRARFASDSKQNHADEGAVADTEGGKKVIIKMKPEAKAEKTEKDGKGKGDKK